MNRAMRATTNTAAGEVPRLFLQGLSVTYVQLVPQTHCLGDQPKTT
jgi:hypothetical protein